MFKVSCINFLFQSFNKIKIVKSICNLCLNPYFISGSVSWLNHGSGSQTSLQSDPDYFQSQSHIEITVNMRPGSRSLKIYLPFQFNCCIRIRINIKSIEKLPPKLIFCTKQTGMVFTINAHLMIKVFFFTYFV